MELQDSPDRLIVCVHHPSLGEDAGVDLYNVLSQPEQKQKVAWDYLEAAHVNEYRQFGKIINRLDNIFEPDGTPLFPEPEADQKSISQEEVTESELRVRQLSDSGWPECYERIIEKESGEQEVIHVCGAIHVFEGIGEEGQLYVRREWASYGTMQRNHRAAQEVFCDRHGPQRISFDDQGFALRRSAARTAHPRRRHRALHSRIVGNYLSCGSGR